MTRAIDLLRRAPAGRAAGGHATAVAGVAVANTGNVPFVAYLFSGPDLHPEAPPAGPVAGSW